jgi:hypothetical protein
MRENRVVSTKYLKKKVVIPKENMKLDPAS